MRAVSEAQTHAQAIASGVAFIFWSVSSCVCLWRPPHKAIQICHSFEGGHLQETINMYVQLYLRIYIYVNNVARAGARLHAATRRKLRADECIYMVLNIT